MDRPRTALLVMGVAGPERVADAVRAARAAGAPVVFVAPEGAGDGSAGLAPEPGEQVVRTRRTSAFADTGLGATLDAAAVGTVALCGSPTGGVVLATAMAAADLGYRVEVLADACADPRPQAHELLLGRVLPATAEVVSVTAWTSRFG